MKTLKLLQTTLQKLRYACLNRKTCYSSLISPCDVTCTQSRRYVRGFSRCLSSLSSLPPQSTSTKTSQFSSANTSKSPSSTSSTTTQIPDQARVVICGGGVVGLSVAYHLSQRGWTDVVVLEQGRLGCGTSWHAAGLVGQMRSRKVQSDICTYSRNLYKHFEDQGHSVGWKQCGSLQLARSKDRLIYFQRAEARAKQNGPEAHIITAKEVKDKCPEIRHEDLEGALWVPGDGVVNPTDLLMVFAKLAKEKGVKMFEGIQVYQIPTENLKVSNVVTSHGTIKCEYFVNCSGMWSREVGKRTIPRVRVPVHACEHFYIVTKPFGNIDPMMPVVRDYDGQVYIREWSGGVLAGGFEPQAKPVFHNGVPENFEYQLLPEDWDHFQVLLEPILHRFPGIGDAQVRQLLNGPECFTPDGTYIIGETPEVDNYFVAAGMNSSGIAGSGGVGKEVADWIVDGTTSKNLWSVDVSRFVDLHNNRRFLRDRVKEAVGHLYSISYPTEEYGSSRKLRTSPLHTRLEVAGAVFGETNAYETPMWFVPNADDEFVEQRMSQGTFSKPDWFNIVKDEYWACKERVCIIDMSSFSKIEVKSANQEAANFLQYLCSNDVDLDVGSVVNTGMQNEFGGYENDCSVARLSDNYYFLISPTTQQTKSLAWLLRHLPKDGSIQVRDVTSMYSAITLIGPHAQELLAEVTEASTTKSDFKFMTCKVVDVGYASGIRAMRLTHVGEDGFILYIPAEYALHVYDTLMRAGVDYGIRNVGFNCMKELRVEKFFASWGVDLTPITTPFECGREFRVKFNKGDFIGKEALLQQREEGVKQKLVHFLLEDHNIDTDLWPWGGEPIYRNGEYVGETTSSGYGFTLEQMLCLGYVSKFDNNCQPSVMKNLNDFILDKNAKYEIDISGHRFAAKVGIYTPKSALAISEPSFIPVPHRTRT
ncbi:pyruvate dehydrogenase phosphatase regulatory subunit, mitochondrial-like [Argonauta hians]